MKQLTGIAAECYQSFTLIVGNEEAIINLKYLEVTRQWFFDLEFRGQNIYGVKLTLGCLHINNYNFPFDFVVQDTSNSGIDPFQIDDFFGGRCILYQITAEEIATYRGYNVTVS
jgi:hypothetical protein